MKKTQLASLLLFSFIFSNFTFFNQNTPPHFSGQIVVQESNLGSKVGGRIKAILKHEGENVVNNEIIIHFDEREHELRLAEAKAKLSQAQSHLEKMKNGYLIEEIALKRAEVEAISAVYVVAENNYKRQEKLFKSNATTAQELEEKKSLYLQSKAQKTVSEKSLLLYTNGFRKEDIDSANASVDEAKAAYALAQLEMQESVIVAPFDGRIERVSVEIGDLVSKNQSVVSVSDVKNKYVKFYVSHTYLSSFSLAQEVRIKVEGEENFTKGKVFFIASHAEFTPKNISSKEERQHLYFALKASVEDSTLKSGMYVDVYLP